MKDVGIPLEEWNGSIATRELHDTIRQFNESANAQTRQLIRLTWALTWLTAVMLLVVVVQVALAISERLG
jgi:hypothetical protein